jgi:pimeloyl-ACP methyl ester carboxylesterase
LFITQILLVLASSPLSWTGIGSGRFCLVGYSLGGGIAAVFASYFGQLLSSLVLLAPSGLLRDSRINFQSRLLYSQSLIPDALLKFLVAWRLRRGPLVPDRESANGKTVGADDALVQELPEPGSAPVDLLSRAYPEANIRPAVSWQVRSNAGFVHSFISSMRHGPILQRNELPSWRRLGKMLTQQRNLSPDQELQAKGLRSGKVLVMCAKHDAIIARDELVEDATAALEGNVEFRFFNAGHEFGSTKSNEVALQIMEFWGWTT